VDQLSASAGRVVVLADPPGGEDLAECATRFNSPSDCDSSVTRDYLRRTQRESGAVSALGRPASVVEYVSTLPWFCTGDGQCPAFVGSTTVRADRIHITSTYSQQLAPMLREVLDPSA
jgi:hypothetical protein